MIVINVTYMKTEQRKEGHCKRNQHDREHQAELDERETDVPEHDDVDSKHRQTTDEDHKVYPTQEDEYPHTIAKVILEVKSILRLW